MSISTRSSDSKMKIEKKTEGQLWLKRCSIYFVFYTGGLLLASFSSVLNQYSLDRGYSDVTISGIFTIFVFGSLLSTYYGEKIIAHKGTSASVHYSIFCGCIAMPLLSYLPDGWIAIPVFINGMVFTFSTLAGGILANAWEHKYKVTVMGAAFAFVSIGSIMSLLLNGYLLNAGVSIETCVNILSAYIAVVNFLIFYTGQLLSKDEEDEMNGGEEKVDRNPEESDLLLHTPKTPTEVENHSTCTDERGSLDTFKFYVLLLNLMVVALMASLVAGFAVIFMSDDGNVNPLTSQLGFVLFEFVGMAVAFLFDYILELEVMKTEYIVFICNFIGCIGSITLFISGDEITGNVDTKWVAFLGFMFLGVSMTNLPACYEIAFTMDGIDSVQLNTYLTYTMVLGDIIVGPMIGMISRYSSITYGWLALGITTFVLNIVNYIFYCMREKEGKSS